MKAVCPICSQPFELALDAGHVRCPNCLAPLRAESFGDTQVLEVATPPAGGGPGGGISTGMHQPVLKLDTDSSRAEHPKEFAGYQILAELGRGGMGVVYKARDPKLDRTVAIKVLLAAEHASTADVERFFREALSVARLHHPCIVPIHEMKTHDGRHYFTMDYVEGLPLDRVLRDGRIGLRRTLVTIEKVASALHHAHLQGVIHRDLKPANIIITPQGEPRITDFGLAKTMAGGEGEALRLTKTGLAIGTPHYMAPEQAAGRSRYADARTDVYSLGCVLYEMLSGRPPFNGATAVEILQKHMGEAAAPPVGRGVRLPEDVVTICMKCLEKEPARRYRTAGELADDLRRFLDGEPIAARRASVVYMIRRSLLRHRKTAIGIAAALASLTGAGAANLVGLRRERSRLVQALYFSNIALAQRHAQEANIAHVDRILSDCPPELRGWEWGRVRREAHQELVSSRRLAGPPTRPRFSADGNRVIATLGDRDLVIDAATGALLSTGPAEPAPDDTGEFSPDGKHRVRINFGPVGPAPPGGAPVRRGSMPGSFTVMKLGRAGRGKAGGQPPVDLVDGEEVVQDFPAAHQGAITEVAFGPRGMLVTRGQEGVIRVWRIGSDKPVCEFADMSRPVNLLVFDRDAKHLVVGDIAGHLILVELAGRKTVTSLPGHAADMTEVAFSPDGERMASASQDRTVRIWRMINGEELLCLRGHSDAVRGVAFSPDGGLLATASADGTVKIWDALRDRRHFALGANMRRACSVVFRRGGRMLYAGLADGVVGMDSATGREVVRWEEAPRDARPLAASPDGSLLAVGGAGPAVTLHDPGTGERKGEFAYAAEGEVLALAFSPDGRFLAGAGTGGTIRIWRMDGRGELPRPDGHSGAIRALAWSPDGKLLASGAEDNAVRVWDAASGRRVALPGIDVIGQGSCWGLAFSPDGGHLAAAIMNNVRIYDTATWQESGLLLGHAVRIFSLDWSPDGRRIATAGKDCTVRLWDADTGRELLKLEGHTDWVNSVAFGPDGRRLASSGADGTVRVWLADDWSSH